jgi:hypothetical protein
MKMGANVDVDGDERRERDDSVDREEWSGKERQGVK